MSKRRSARIVMLAAALGAPVASYGQVSGTWIGPVEVAGSWSNSANWTSSPSYPGGGGAAFFENPYIEGFLAPGVILDVPTTLSSLHFDLVNPVTILGSAPLTLTGPAQIDVPQSPTYDVKPDPTSFLVDAGHVIDAPIAGTNGLLKTGDGVLSLVATNTFTGTVAVNGGILRVGSGEALNFNQVKLDGGILSMANPATLGQLIRVNAGGGTLMTESAFETISGQILGTGPLVMFPGFTLTGNNTHSGNLSIIGFGYGDATLQAGGRLANGRIDLVGARLIDDNSLGANSNRLPDNSEVRLISGAFELDGNGTTPINEQVGTLTLAGGSGTVTVSGSMTQLTVGQLKRDNRATGQLRSGVVLGNAASFLVGDGGSAGTTNQSIIPFVVGPNGHAVTHDASGVRELTNAEYYTPPGTSISAFVTTQNVRLTSVTVDNLITVNSLFVDNANLSGDGTITISSGLLSGTGGGVQTPPIQFGSTEGVVYSYGSLNLVGRVYGTNGLTIAGPGVTLSGISYYTGQTTVNGELGLGDNVPALGPGPLGSDTSPVVLTGRDASLSASNSVTFGRDILIKSVAVNDHTHGPTIGSINIFGNVELQQWINLNGNVTFNGNISGSGGISMVGPIGQPIGPIARNATFSGNNTFVGGMDIEACTVTINSNSALGSGVIRLGNPSDLLSGIKTTWLRAIGGNRTISNPMIITGKISLLGSLTLSGPISLNGGSVAILGGTITGSVSDGFLSFNGGTLSGNNHQLATYTTSLVVTNSLALGDAPISTNLYGGPLTLSGGISIPAHPLNFVSYPGASLRSIGGFNVWNGPVNTSSNDGSIFVDSGSALSFGASVYGSANVTKSGAGPLDVQNIRESNLTLDGGTVKVRPNGTDAGVSLLPKITGAPTFSGGTFDLTNNAIIADYSVGIDPDTAAQSYRSSLQSGTLISSMADASHQLVYVSNTVLGLSSFMGQPIDPTTVLIKYTYCGDANLDGVVNVADLNALANAWQSTQIASGADFNYDGQIDIQDLKIMAANWGAGAGGASVPALSPLLISLGLPDVTIPEPNSILIIGVYGALMDRRRRKR